ncbi:MAG: uroporphyrinogen decarboxylase family protein [Acidobacteriota bacterium]
MGIVGPVTMNSLLAKRGNERGLTDLVEQPELVMEVGTRAAINRAKALIQTGSDLLYIGDAASFCFVISPRHFREYCLPYYQRFVEALRPLDKPIYLHICGHVRPIVDTMVESGPDCIEPLDPLGGMTVAEFRARVGSRTALMGAVNTLTLAGGTAEDVRREAVECIQAGGQNGGYILAAGDMVPNEAPAVNVAELCRTARRFSYEPLLNFD